MILDSLSVLARSSKGGWSPDGDGRVIVDRDAGLFLTADGSGPTYGGYHAPFGLDAGLEALHRAFRASNDGEPARLLGAIAAADAVMKRLEADHKQVLDVERSRTPGDLLGAALRAADAVRPPQWRHGKSYCHFAGGVTACSVRQDGDICFAQLGGGRGYLLRRGEIRLVVKDHTLLTQAADSGKKVDASHRVHRHVVLKALGFGARPEPHLAQEHLEPQDIVLLCTEGVWNHDGGDELVRRLFAASPAELDRLLNEAAQEHRQDAAAIRLSLPAG